jgi:hypothetical protein
MQAGQSRILVVGGETANDAGSATLHVSRIGTTLMEGAQALTLGANPYSVGPREPALPYPGACGSQDWDRMGNASRFTFVPAKNGTYRFSFCGSGRRRLVLSSSPNLAAETITRALDGCINGGGRITAQLQAGTTYYVAAGYEWANDDACQTRSATVEYIPTTADPSCSEPLPLPLGATPAATLLSFPAFQVEAPCQGAQTIHHAAFFRVTAAESGWYSLHIVPSDAAGWLPRTAILASCTQSTAETFGWVQTGRVFCDAGDSQLRFFTAASFHMQAGQSRILVVGGETANDAGSATLHVSRIGTTLMEGAQALTLGANPYSVGPREPALPYPGACGSQDWDRMGNASRFTFVPAKNGTYRFSFCGSGRRRLVLSSSPNLAAETITRALDGCINGGGRITAQLQAGTTYYVAAGYEWANDDACQTRSATVEYIPSCPADFNDDDVTDGIDLGVLLAAWGTPARDITGDGVTDGIDLGILLAMWGPCPD